MTPVHVLVTSSEAEEQAYASAFGGAVDVYRFATNVEAFERLTSAASPIDVVVTTATQDGVFNISGAQLAQRLGSPAIRGTASLASLQVVVVGEQLPPGIAGATSVPTLDAAIRLVKYGEAPVAPIAERHAELAGPLPELELSTPAAAPPAPAPAAPAPISYSLGTPEFAGSVISSIWDAPDPKEVHRKQQEQLATQERERAEQAARMRAAQESAARQAAPEHPQRHPQHMQQQQVRPQQGRPTQPRQQQPGPGQPAPGRRRQLPRGMGAVGGGGPAQQAPARQPQAQQAPSAPALFARPTSYDAPPAHGLRAAQATTAPSRGQYHGTVQPQMRMPADPEAHRAHVRLQLPPPQGPNPPELASQVQHLVYGSMPTEDPVMAFSSPIQQQLAAQAAPANAGMVAAPMYAPQPASIAMQPMVGGPAQQAAPAPAQQQRAGGPLQRMRERVVSAERAPVVPAAGAPSAAFAVPEGLMNRAMADDDVSFG